MRAGIVLFAEDEMEDAWTRLLQRVEWPTPIVS